VGSEITALESDLEARQKEERAKLPSLSVSVSDQQVDAGLTGDGEVGGATISEGMVQLDLTSQGEDGAGPGKKSKAQKRKVRRRGSIS
jgi:hypothetical protein